MTMPILPDGTYSIVMSAIAGSSVAVVTIASDELVGNDIAGARYRGKLRAEGDALILDLVVTIPPGVFLIWGTSPSDVWQKRPGQYRLPRNDVEEGRPIFLANEQAWLIFRRIPDISAPLARSNGLRVLISMLESADAAWRANEGSLPIDELNAENDE